VDQQFEIPRNTEVQVMQNVMGIGRPNIQLKIKEPNGSGKLPRDGTARLSGRMVEVTETILGAGMLDDVKAATRELAGLAGALKPVADEVARLLRVRDIQDVDATELTANLDTLIQRFDGTLKSINLVIGDDANRRNIQTTLANMNRASEAGTAMLEAVASMAAEGRLAMVETRTLLKKLARTSDEMSVALKRVNQTFYAINEGKGTIPLMLHDNRLYESLVLTVKRLAKTLDDIREVMEIVKQGKLQIKTTL